MGIKERKIRERERIHHLILSSAQELVVQHGVDGLTMRAIANDIEYSQSKLYEFFESKDKLCEALCEINCQALLEKMKSIRLGSDKEAYLTDLVMTTVEFHAVHPHSDELLTLVCFAPERFKIPESFIKIESLFILALKALASPHLVTDAEVLSALDIIRCLFIGVSKLMVSGVRLGDKTRGLEITGNALKALLRGWKT